LYRCCNLFLVKESRLNMTLLNPLKTEEESLPGHISLVLILVFWICFAVFFALYLPEPYASLVGFLPGLAGVGVLLWNGFSPRDCYLSAKRPSRAGGLLLALLTLFMLPVAWSGLESGGWAGLNFWQLVVFAPASGIAQELYFRSALLPALETVFSRRLALLGSSAMFALFHLGMLRVAPVWAVGSALGLTFIVGLGWGWQVQRDRTVLWAMAHHALLQMILRLFAW
jgi:membrane protease YdiL (CAAX protease family)